MIYLANNASTALDPEVREAMAVAADWYGNPSSVHSAGRRARRAVEESREEVARLIGAGPDEIFFTSGGTEANALAIFGTLSGEGGGRVVLTAAEHPSVREPIASLADRFEIRTVPPEGSGALDPANVIDSTTPATRFVSVMAANNEYGGLYPIGEIATRLRERGAPIHTDAVQAAGRVPIDVESWGVDLLALSAHKLHGPKGVGALWVRRGLAIRALVPGGGQEKKIRGGTENTIGIVGFGIAARLARERLPLEPGRIARLRDRLESGILESIPGTRAVGAGAPRLPNTTAILFVGLAGDALLFRLDLEGVAVSVGSACSSGTLEPSPAILALGLPRQEAKGVVRFSLSRLTTEAEIDRVLEILPRVVAEARAIRSPAAVGAPAVP
ncbi:MAG TPA: cysteine desulfurase family protein [Thermoanaerobaculia bacterium]|nr:cysteine desulfurase family protein [Thermoanaerobaculia bacterium]